MILEAVTLNIVEGQSKAFQASFQKALSLISSMKGFISYELHHCLENENRFLLLVNWNTLEDHTIGFRQSNEYQEWKRLLHHFYDPFPQVEHYQKVI